MDLFLVNTFNPFSPLLSCWLSMTTTLINIQQRQLSTRGARFGAVNKNFANCDVCRKATQQTHKKREREQRAAAEKTGGRILKRENNEPLSVTMKGVGILYGHM